VLLGQYTNLGIVWDGINLKKIIMFRYKMTLPRTLLFLFISLSLSIYVIKNFSEINTLKLILYLIIIGMMTCINLNYILQLFNKKKI